MIKNYYSIERLLMTPYKIIDIMPYQVSEKYAGRYDDAERYFMDPVRLKEIRQAQADIVIRLSCYSDMVFMTDPADDEGRNDMNAAETAAAFESVRDSGFIRVLIPSENAMIDLWGGDTYMTVYNAEGKLAELIEKLAASSGLFMWQPPQESRQVMRVRYFEGLMMRACDMMDAGQESDELEDIMNELDSYYTGEEWKEDFEADEKGMLPDDLRRGVLSEDGLYDLLERYRDEYGHING